VEPLYKDDICNCGFGGDRFIEEGDVFLCSICGREVKPIPKEEKKWTSKVRKKILFIDDQIFYHSLVKETLLERNLFVEGVTTGLEGVRCVVDDLKLHIISYKEDLTCVFSLVILDLNMPGILSGIQTLGVIKTIQPSLNIIILTSAPPEKKLLTQLKALKANHYMKKSNENIENNLVSSVRKFIGY